MSKDAPLPYLEAQLLVYIDWYSYSDWFLPCGVSIGL